MIEQRTLVDKLFNPLYFPLFVIIPITLTSLWMLHHETYSLSMISLITFICSVMMLFISGFVCIYSKNKKDHKCGWFYLSFGIILVLFVFV